jgi:hypothetical protein
MQSPDQKKRLQLEVAFAGAPITFWETEALEQAATE